MSIFDYILLFTSVLLGGGLAYYFRHKQSERQLQLVLALSGAYLLGITFLHLFPGIFAARAGSSPAIWVLVGFFVQLLLENLSQGVEHGHVHAHRHAPTAYAWQVMIGLCLHALLEGLPLDHYPAFGHDHAAHGDHNHLLWGIVLHKAPAAFALVTVFLRSGYGSSTVWGSLLVFASMSPLGALGSTFLPESDHLITAIMALVAGSFLHIATTILFEADTAGQHRVSWQKLSIIVIGMFLAWLTL